MQHRLSNIGAAKDILENKSEPKIQPRVAATVVADL